MTCVSCSFTQFCLPKLHAACVRCPTRRPWASLECRWCVHVHARIDREHVVGTRSAGACARQHAPHTVDPAIHVRSRARPPVRPPGPSSYTTAHNPGTTTAYHNIYSQHCFTMRVYYCTLQPHLVHYDHFYVYELTVRLVMLGRAAAHMSGKHAPSRPLIWLGLYYCLHHYV